LPLGLALLIVAVSTGVVQDYYLYLQMWQEVRLGHDPWWMVWGVFGHYPLNAYGPAFNLLAIPARVHPLLPKLLFAYSYLLFVVWLREGRRHIDGRQGLWLLVETAWLWNPYVWIELGYFGHFDVLVGLCCVAAVVACEKRREALSGAWLALGALIKYMPIVLLPFLALDNGRPRIRLLFSSILLIAAGLGISTMIWGSSVFRPLVFAASRSSHHLSIYRYFSGIHSPINLRSALGYSLDSFAPVILFVALLRAWRWSRIRRPDVASMSVLAILTTLLFYQVGFAQYQMVLFVLASYWVVRHRDTIRNRIALWLALAAYFGWVSLFDTFDAFYGADYNRMQEWVGLPTFLLGCVLIVCVVRSARVASIDADERLPIHTS
jgi:hypothetical protein